MANVHIPANTLATMDTVQHAFKFAGVRGEHTDLKNIFGAWTEATGVPPETPLLVLAALPPEQLKEALDKVMVETVDKTKRKPNMLETAQMATIGRIASLKAAPPPAVTTAAAASTDAPGASPTSDQAAGAAEAPVHTDALGRRAKLNVILSLILEVEVQEDVKKSIIYYGRWEAVYGEGDRPEPHETPSPLQLAGVEYLKLNAMNPYLDYCVWGPHHYRIMRAMKVEGCVLGPDGTLQTKERPGPPTIHEWKASNRLQANSFLMSDILDMGISDQYLYKIEGYHRQFGPELWFLLYQADVRFRMEWVERLAIELEIQHEKDHPGTSLDPAVKWRTAWRKGLDDDKFWNREFYDVAVAIALKLKKKNDADGGDARSANSVREHVATTSTDNTTYRDMISAASWNHGGSGNQYNGPSLKKQRIAAAAAEGHPKVVDGVFVTTSSGAGICDGWNAGTCTQRGYCPHNKGARQCKLCLRSDHGACDPNCPNKDGAKPKKVGKGKGKGKSKGVGKGKGKWNIWGW